MTQNAGKAVDQKLEILRSDYERGFPLLLQMPDAGLYTWDLYLWAAMIFGTRSFRPSLTISMDALSTSALASNPRFDFENDLAMTNVEKDNFSVLHPLLDIGNHNGENHVQWSVDIVNRFHVVTTAPVAKGEQVYNFYGPKTNGE
jgi:hypothetical protein